ncbi:MAG: amidohydrolase [Winkia sp. UMB750B]|nr:MULTISPECIES: amidohydrolase [unclassified Winkia]MDK7905994.1 amidohydrolase [Winkia sp. UMB0889B]MDK8225117.1 amidohydrolase [Winkia sp. UMB750B]
MSNIAKLVTDLKDWQEGLYKELHSHPELSMQEEWTRERIAQELTDLGAEPKRIGGGVVAVLENGEGSTILSRADFDALPLKEETGLDFASTVTQKDADGNTTPVMHGCGHDMHTACLLGAIKILLAQKDLWQGTFIALFQPGEETAQGAKSMVEDGLVDQVPKPEVCLAQHVVGIKEGTVNAVCGPTFSGATSLKITVYGKGSHGSMPHLSIDPIVMAAAIVLRLQTIVSRETSPSDFAVVTVGSITAGTSANTIPDSATLQLNVRTYKESVQKKVTESIERIVKAECAASGSDREPEFEYFNRYPLTANPEEQFDRITGAFKDYFGDRYADGEKVTASEDFTYIPKAFDVPYFYWTFGGFPDPESAPGNHSPQFAPTMSPSLQVGTEAQVVAALEYLGK